MGFLGFSVSVGCGAVVREKMEEEEGDEEVEDDSEDEEEDEEVEDEEEMNEKGAEGKIKKVCLPCFRSSGVVWNLASLSAPLVGCMSAVWLPLTLPPGALSAPPVAGGGGGRAR